jgi:hypothetical protein
LLLFLLKHGVSVTRASRTDSRLAGQVFTRLSVSLLHYVFKGGHPFDPQVGVKNEQIPYSQETQEVQANHYAQLHYEEYLESVVYRAYLARRRNTSYVLYLS